MNIMRPLVIAARSVVGIGTPLAATLLSLSVAHAQSTYATPYTFTTLAGSPYLPSAADGTGAAASLFASTGVAVDGSGNAYVADAGTNTIRKITPSGVVTTIAGAAFVAGSADGTGSAARFNSPSGIALDGSGNLYVTDQLNATIRKITPAGIVTTLAGTAGVVGGADGTGPAAQFGGPFGIAVDGGGNVYVADYVNETIRKITPAGVTTTLAGSTSASGIADGTGSAARFSFPYGIAVDGGGNAYVADAGNNTIRKITSGGVVTTIAGAPGTTGTTDATGSAARFYVPIAIAIDGSGNLYVADYYNQTIRKITSSAVVTTLAGSAGTLGFADGTGTAAEFEYPLGIAVDGSGNVYVADNGNNTIRKITSSGATTTLAGTPGQGFADGTGSAARFYYPTDMAVDGSGNLYVADNANCTIRKVTSSGVVTTFAGSPGHAGSADGTGSAAQFNYPYGVALDGSGNLYVADQGNETIRKVTPSGVVTTIAGSPGVKGSVNGTGSAALFHYPAGIAVDGSGNIFVSEQQNFDIRKITSSGVVTTLAGTAGAVGSTDGTGAAAQFNQPAGIATDGNGNIYVAEYGSGTIRKVTPAGVVTTLAGKAGSQGSADGTGSAAQFDAPSGVAVDASGNVFVADEKNNTIRKITPAGVVTTLGGTPLVPGNTNGTGAAALFNQPFDVVVDGSGNIYVADASNDLIRKGSFSSAPQVQTQPSDQYVSAGGSATFTVAATGATALSYQWNFNGSPISGATGSSYTVANAQSANAGSYTVTVTDAAGSVTSSAANLTINSGTSTARLINISTRAQVGTGANILIPGFVIGGSGTETLLVRGDGPSLAAFGVSGALAQVSLKVFDSGGNQIASNIGWGTNSNPALIASTAAQVGAFSFASGSADCALIANLPPGAYTVQVAGVGSSTGVALAEIYEVSATGTTRLINISTRAQVGTGANIIIPGFVVQGSGNEKLLVRGDGPSLTQFGVGGVLAQPSLSVFSGSTLIASNTGWSTVANPAQIASVAAQVGAFSFAANSADCAQVVNLTAGAYTMQVSGVNSTTGVALAEVYEAP
jgi:sugar lactone lactonase YvrE